MDSHSDFADRIRSMIQREGDLVNHRMTWFLTSQTILFAGLGLAWGKDVNLSTIIAIIGLAVCASTRVSTQAAIRATADLEQCWIDRCEKFKIDQALEPPINGLNRAEVRLIEKIFFPWRFLPWFLGLAWVALALLARFTKEIG